MLREDLYWFHHSAKLKGKSLPYKWWKDIWKITIALKWTEELSFMVIIDKKCTEICFFFVFFYKIYFFLMYL